MGSSAILAKAITGAPLRSTPKAGNAWENLLSAKAATAIISAAVTDPCPPRPCKRISFKGLTSYFLAGYSNSSPRKSDE
jgi:hypothetical protein